MRGEECLKGLFDEEKREKELSMLFEEEELERLTTESIIPEFIDNNDHTFVCPVANHFNLQELLNKGLSFNEANIVIKNGYYFKQMSLPNFLEEVE